MKRLVLALALLAPLSASATPITVTLSDDDQNLVTQALDAYQRAQGLGQTIRVGVFLQKLTSALNAPPKSEKPDANVPEVKPAP